MPEYLPEHIPDAERGTWRAMSLRMAREHAEECVAISEELSKSDTLFDGRVLLARIAAAEGNVTAAVSTLQAMLEETTDDDHRAQLHYRLWKLNATDGDHRTEALRLYAQLFEKTPKHDYRKPIDELTGATEPATSEATDTCDTASVAKYHVFISSTFL